MELAIHTLKKSLAQEECLLLRLSWLHQGFQVVNGNSVEAENDRLPAHILCLKFYLHDRELDLCCGFRPFYNLVEHEKNDLLNPFLIKQNHALARQWLEGDLNFGNWSHNLNDVAHYSIQRTKVGFNLEFPSKR